jgi:hypothetical protein
MCDKKGFIAQQLFPVFPTALQSAAYYKFTANAILNVPTIVARAPGSSYPRLEIPLENDSYTCHDYGIECPVPDETRKKYANFFSADQAAISKLVDTIRINLETRVAAAAVGSSVTSANVVAPWNDPSSDPKGDIDAGREVIRKATGLLPNTLVITQPMLNRLNYHPKVLDVFKYTTPGLAMEDKLAQYFGVDRVLVARSVAATNNVGQTFTASDIWGNKALLAVTSGAMDLETPCFGRIFSWSSFTSEITPATGGTGPGMETGGSLDIVSIFSYRDDTRKSDVHRGEHYVVEKLVAPATGYVITNVIQ